MKNKTPPQKGKKGAHRKDSPFLARLNDRRNCASKSTGTAAQKARILAWLRKRTLTTDQGRAMGCYSVASRIFDLRRDGHNIVTELFDGYAADGYSHARLARYRLTNGLPHGKRTK